MTGGGVVAGAGRHGRAGALRGRVEDEVAAAVEHPLALGHGPRVRRVGVGRHRRRAAVQVGDEAVVLRSVEVPVGEDNVSFNLNQIFLT